MQLPPAQIKAFALSRGTRAKTDRIDAELIAGFMLFRPKAGRTLPSKNLRTLRALTTRRAQIVDMRKQLSAQISAREKQGISEDVVDMDDALRTMLDDQIADLERRIASTIAQDDSLAAKARLLRSIPRIGPVSVAMLIAEMPELGRMTAGEAAAMTGLAPMPHDSGTMRGKRRIGGGRRALRHVLFQAALAASCRNQALKTPRQTSQRTWQAPQAHHNRDRTQARNNRKRSAENRNSMAIKSTHLDTVARLRTY